MSRRGFMTGCGATLAFAIAGGGIGSAAATQQGPKPIGPLLDDMPDNRAGGATTTNSAVSTTSVARRSPPGWKRSRTTTPGAPPAQ